MAVSSIFLNRVLIDLQEICGDGTCRAAVGGPPPNVVRTSRRRRRLGRHSFGPGDLEPIN
ncbi:hypothetical protein [Catenuloplanes atrovinosus]|uniref:Uncharacterized protein n=1 Tax=Catenuloplanes atrovinosus TaxID=137266 RepID=A0AAE3YR01_9ACTN|nr:hypothetical protein [Catenuloplanes atrovinosus]MDR7277051.1 hypothetical protein [Catenuloplanes atrovinosus]